MGEVYGARDTKLLASLNHPAIAAIYGLEPNALVPEHVEGPTLAAVIRTERGVRAANSTAG